ncbi:MAG: hypothetical protein C4306_12230 [Thermoleophilia bacterium]
MRAALALAAALAGLTLLSAAGASVGPTRLTITFWLDEAVPEDSQTWTLRCSPPGGTLPKPARACRRLARLGRAAFAPVPAHAACTDIYGGPQLALVRGLVDGRRVWALLRRRNGCEIARWDRLSPWLLPRAT